MPSTRHPAPPCTAPHRTHRALACLALAAAALLAAAGSARAALLDTLSVRLEAPSDPGAPYIQSLPLSGGIVAPNLGGTGDISLKMLDDERIAVEGHSFLVRVAAGSADGLATGWGDQARYVVSGIAVAGAHITGFSVHAFDGFARSGSSSGLAAGLVPADFVSFNAGFDTLQFRLDDGLAFTDRGLGGAFNYAEFRIDLVTGIGPPPPPVPEPGTLWLVALGGAGLLLGRRALRPAAAKG